jgi:hypothetical protein
MLPQAVSFYLLHGICAQSRGYQMSISSFKDRTDEMIARSDIQSTILRRARGADRNDWFGDVRNAYFDDAIDRHGIVNLPVEEFVAWAHEFHKTVDQSIHYLSNINIEFLTENHALAESYGRAIYFFGKDAPNVDKGSLGLRVETMFRYLDHFERRNNEWRIKERRLVVEGRQRFPIHSSPDPEKADYLKSRRDFQDPYYLMREQLARETVRGE